MARPERREEERYAAPRAVEPVERPTSIAAVLSTVLGVLSLIAIIVSIGGILGPITAIILGVLAIIAAIIGFGEISDGNKKGSGWAIAGILLGFGGLILGILAAAFGIILIPFRIVT